MLRTRSQCRTAVLEQGRVTLGASAGLVLACALLAVAGCGGSSSTSESEPPAAGTTTTTAPTTTAEQADPLAGASTSIVVAPSTAKATALLERVAVGHHEGYDRVVFQFRDKGLPGYRIEYVEPPLKEDGLRRPGSTSRGTRSSWCGWSRRPAST